MKAAYCTLGCKVNQYDTQAMRELMENAGYDTVDFEDEADVYIVNTCTVTATGDKKSRQMISRAHGRNPDAKIVVAGCYSQRAPEEGLSLPGVSLVIGSKDRANIVGLLANLHEGRLNAVGSLMGEHEFEELVATREGRTRAHLKIQEGCDRYCTYCADIHWIYVLFSCKFRNIGNIVLCFFFRHYAHDNTGKSASMDTTDTFAQFLKEEICKSKRNRNLLLCICFDRIAVLK